MADGLSGGQCTMNSWSIISREEKAQSKRNPSVLVFEQELENILLKFAKRNSSGDGFQIRDNIGKRKVDLSKLFKEFKPRLKHEYFLEKLMQIGSFLFSIKAFRQAKYQCFTRYLQEISLDFTCIESVAEMTFETFKENYFPNGLDNTQSIDTIKVLYEDMMCSYELVIEWDPKLQNPNSVNQCLKLLKILMLTTQVAMHQEPFSWLIYNGTIHIYTISQKLMVTGRSNLVLEYMLWACMCMEGSIPLLTLKYLPWRSTLYTSVSLCYLDCKESQQAEIFARRALKKITELADIEEMSTSVASPESKALFEAAKVKINAVIFQRVVFESRKRPKGLLRPKVRHPLREALHSNWPRNHTERMLSDLFEDHAAKFLGILHTLGDPHRRTLQCKAPTGTIDDVTLDIYPELFVAAVDLISGGNKDRTGRLIDLDAHPSGIELTNVSLFDYSQKAGDGIPVSLVVKFMKLAFSYEQWEVIELMLQPIMTFLLKNGSEVVQTPAYLISLQLLVALEPFFNNPGNKDTRSAADELLAVANILNGFSSDIPKSSLPFVDVDMIIDATVFLWNRCKPFFQRVVSSNVESCRQVLNDKDCDKWLFILLTVDNVLHWSGLSDIDPILAAEVALKLALVLECRACFSKTRAGNSADVSKSSRVNERASAEPSKSEGDSEMNKEKEAQTDGKNEPFKVGFPDTSHDLLCMAINILESCVERVSEAREKMAKQWLGESIDKSSSPDENESSTNNIQIMHLELLFNLTRVLSKLQTTRLESEKPFSAEMTETFPIGRYPNVEKSKSVDTSSWIDDLMKKYKKVPLTRALLLMHTTQNNTIENAQQNLQECYDLIKKCQKQERLLVSRCKVPDNVEATAVPPSPILVYRSTSKITFKPAPFQPLCHKKVCWYRLFGCSASGSNVKVRLNDSDLDGTGFEVPAGSDCRFYVSNLREGERYVFAVAAYDRNGDLIGDGIGPTGQPCLASHPMPLIMTWAYLTQVAYSCGIHNIARNAAQVLWEYFVPEKSKDDAQKHSHSDGQLSISLYKCDEKLLAVSNQALVRQFLQSIFISVDIAVQNGKLFCDSFCDNGTLLPGQILRIRQCEKMLLVIQISLWLNDQSLALQGVTRCYGLVAPFLQLKIPSKPIVQILLQCYAVIQEIPTLNRFRRNSVTYDSLYHLIAVITHYLVNVFTTWGEDNLASSIKESSRTLLISDTPQELTSNSVFMIPSQEGTSNGHQSTGKTKKKGSKGKEMKKTKGTVVKTDVRPEQTVKTGSIQKSEFVALESVYMKRTGEAVVEIKNDFELTGAEDCSILLGYVSALSTNDAHKEVLKFKRRSKYLQYFVLVVEKALADDSVDKVLEWSYETEQWLSRRNDSMMPSQKPAVTQSNSDSETDDWKNKKYATAIVEFGKPTATKSRRTMRQLLDTLADVHQTDCLSPEKPSTKPAKLLKPSPESRTPPYVPRIIRKTRRKVKTNNEQDLIRAIEVLQSKLPCFWKSGMRKRKLRSISNDENPWRCQWNIIRGLAYFRTFLKNSKKSEISSSDPTKIDSNALDSEWFAFDISGILIRQCDSILKDPSPNFKNLVLSFTTTNYQHAPMKKKEQQKCDVESEYLRYVYYASQCFSRALVLAYRCKCWGLLQNACSHLWNTKQQLLEYVVDASSQITDDVLYELNWNAFYFAADVLLDMIFIIKKDEKDSSKTATKSDSFWGDLESEKGGSDLIFEEYLDETILDVVWIKRVIMYCMECLFYKEKWEKLANIIFRFNALSQGRYADKVLPLLTLAQANLAEIARKNGGVSSTQPEVVISEVNGKPQDLKIHCTVENGASFDPAVHIDPKGHDVYTEDNNAQRLFCVPLDTSSTLKLLRNSVDMKHCAASALQHSRELFLRYLAGLGKTLKRSPSRVAFVSSEDESVAAIPSDISGVMFDKIDDVQKSALTSSQLAIVITSYDKTIEMLQFHGRRALLAQAMNEIGNIMLHIGNRRAACRWWQTVLDTILSPVSTPSENGHANHYHDAVHIDPSVLLKKRGIWGCLLAAVTAGKMARYIENENADRRLDYCCMAASLLKAMFSSSLPHPISNSEFALYDIGNGFPMGNLIPGINLFSDPFRCDARVLLSSTCWLAEQLIDTGHYLMVLPLLTLARYISSDVFENKHSVIRVLILRIRALTKAGMLSHSYHVLATLLLGRHNGKQSLKNQVDIHYFYSEKPVTDTNNIRALSGLISQRLSSAVVTSYGVETCRSLVLEQARLLIAIAASIYAVPTDCTKLLVEKLGRETHCGTVALDSSKPSKPSCRIFEENVNQGTVKSNLLAGAKLLLEDLRHEILGPQKDLKEFLNAKDHLFKAVDVKMLLLVEIEIANIFHQHFQSLQAAQLIYECMRSLEDASVLLEHDATRLGSAWTAKFSRSPDLVKTPVEENLSSELGSVKYDFDANLWLNCRVKMIEFLSSEENSVGRIAGFSRSVVALTGSPQQHCEQGLDEGDAFGHSEMVAQFQFDAFVLKLKAGSLTLEDYQTFKSAIDVLETVHPLSTKGCVLLIKMLIYYGDITETFNGTSHDACESFEKAENFLFDQIFALGTSTSNLYLDHSILLAETKLRLGRIQIQTLDPSSDAQRILEVMAFLMEGLKIVSTKMMNQNPLESEFLFLIGMLQTFLWNKGQASDMVVIMSFTDAIKKTYTFDHNLDLMRKCYEQLGLLYLSKARQIESELVKQDADSTSNAVPKQSNTKLRKEDKMKEKQELLIKRETKKELRALWTAARAMAALSAVIDTRGQLHGNITGLSISKVSGEKIPLSVIHDLLGSISICKTENGCYIQQDGVITMNSFVNCSNTVQLTWNHLLSYIEYLQRQVSYQALGIKNSYGPLFRWPKLLKLHQMHEFLSCELDIYVKKSFGVKCSPLLLLPEGPVKLSEAESRLKGKNVDVAGENEISIHWLTPDPLSKQVRSETEYVDCIYAFNSKAVSGSPMLGISAGRKSVLRQTLTDIHGELHGLSEIIENDNIRLPPKIVKPDPLPVSSGGAPATARKKVKKSASIRTISGRKRRELEVQNKLKKCLNSASKMMKQPPLSEKKEIPFDISHANVQTLESVFDPGRGFMGTVPDNMYAWLSSIFNS